MADFMTFASSHAPSYPSRVEAASPGEITELQKYLKFPLPGSYVKYLELAGRNNGGIRLLHDASCDVREILKVYNRAGELLDGDFALIAHGGTTLQEGFLELGSPADAKVFGGSELDPSRVYADSFERLLFRAAFESLHVETLPYWSVHLSSSKAHLLPVVTAFLSQQAFLKHWFSDSFTYCGECPFGAIVVSQFERDQCWCRLGSRSQEEHTSLSQLLAIKFTLTVRLHGTRTE